MGPEVRRGVPKKTLEWWVFLAPGGVPKRQPRGGGKVGGVKASKNSVGKARFCRRRTGAGWFFALGEESPLPPWACIIQSMKACMLKKF